MKRVKSFLLLEAFAGSLRQKGLVAGQQFRFFRVTTLFSIVVYLALLAQMRTVDFNHIVAEWVVSVLFLLIFINYFLLPLHQRTVLAYVVFLMLAFSILHLVTYYSGGIRSTGVLYFAVLILAAYILLGNYAGMLMAGLALLHIIYFYFISAYTNLANYDMVGYDDILINLDFLITGIIATLILATQSGYIEKCEKAVVTHIESKSEALKQVSDRLQLATKAAAIGIWDLDLQTDQLVWDDAMYRLYGCNGNEKVEIYADWEKHLHPEDIVEGSNAVDRAIKESGEFNTEFRIIWPDKSVHHIKANAMVHYDKWGKAIRVIGTNWDITELKNAAEKLAQEQKLLRTMIDNLPDYIYVKDAASRHLINNKASMQLLGAATEEEIIGKVAVERLEGAVAANYLKDDQHVFKTGESIINREEPLYTSNGEKRWLLTTKIPLKDSGNKIIGLVGISRDITELKHTEVVLNDLNEQLKKRAEALAFSNTELERFAYVVSHDLQEPLRMVNSFLKLLENQYSAELDARAKEYIGYATGGAEKMKRLILGLLEYSRVGANTDNFVSVDLNETLREVQETFGIAIEQQHVSIMVPALPVIRGIPLQLHQLFQNLISNAIKYRRDIPLEILIGFKENPDHYLFSVRDNGMGINPKHFEKIFRVFQRVRHDDRYAGTGIGLAICKKIVEKHKGNIWVASVPGEGSTFYFSLPR